MIDDPYFVFSGRYFHSVAVDERALDLDTQIQFVREFP